GEAPGSVATCTGFGQSSEPLADRREGAGIGCGVRARGAAYRRLIDVDDLVEIFKAFDLVVCAGLFAGTIELARGGLVERLDDERRLAAAGNAGDAGQNPDGDFGGDVLKVVLLGADDLDLLFLVDGAAFGRNGNLLETDEILSGQALWT